MALASRAGLWSFWLLLLAAVTWGLHALRSDLGEAHTALTYLLLVLGGSATGGRALGLSLSVLSFLCFNFFLIPPYYTLAIAEPLSWLVLGAFLFTSMIATHLLDRAQRAAAEARQRADELDRLSKLGAESLAAARAEDAVGALTRVLRSTLRLRCCEIYSWDPGPGEFRRLARSAADGEPPDEEEEQPFVDPVVKLAIQRLAAAVYCTDGSSRLVSLVEDAAVPGALATPGARSVVVPLRVRERVVGILCLADRDEMRLDAPARRFAAALSAYAALAVERVRLAAEAEHGETLREASQLKDALLAAVSHDLRTPLTTIKALAEELRGEGDERAMVIEDEADRLNRFVSNLLDLSRLQGGALPLLPELVAAEDLLGAALQRVSGMAREREIGARITPGEPLLVGRFDFTHSLRALVNLLENSLKYSPADSIVEVEVRREGEWVVFRVSDRGPGVSRPEQELIFEPFHRGDAVCGTALGTGLGLAIARRLARAQGGEVAYAPRDGGGSVFTLLLPAVDVAQIGASL